jgi:hypothetical protein
MKKFLTIAAVAAAVACTSYGAHAQSYSGIPTAPSAVGSLDGRPCYFFNMQSQVLAIPRADAGYNDFLTIVLPAVYSGLVIGVVTGPGVANCSGYPQVQQVWLGG